MIYGEEMTDNLSIEELVHQLRSPNNRDAYRALKALEEVSDSCNATYAYIEDFIEMIGDSNSYIRTRGLVLISRNAKWDEDGRIDEVIDEYLTHATDEKPITAQQCVKALVALAKAKPHLVTKIVSSLRCADLSRYPDSMRPLVQADIRDALIELEELETYFEISE